MPPIDDPTLIWVSESKPCTVCHGTGRDRNGWQCWRCGGAGAYPVVRLIRTAGHDGWPVVDAGGGTGGGE